ncbi:hypothetical protein EVAR_14092_1 [Eumeta japonica]|uniref:Uncharacterized protein n=1 Tax=Eumeta variegata TaxID=151549 RepID=A0A4C1UPK0_EUMVA|nr:hypothetical protein EVAR_14092_1 [Eumeta japonica]
MSIGGGLWLLVRMLWSSFDALHDSSSHNDVESAFAGCFQHSYALVGVTACNFLRMCLVSVIAIEQVINIKLVISEVVFPSTSARACPRRSRPEASAAAAYGASECIKAIRKHKARLRRSRVGDKRGMAQQHLDSKRLFATVSKNLGQKQ